MLDRERNLVDQFINKLLVTLLINIKLHPTRTYWSMNAFAVHYVILVAYCIWTWLK